MRDNNFTVSSIHGDMLQKERDAIMEDFREGKTRVLIATALPVRALIVLHVMIQLLVQIDRIGAGGGFFATVDGQRDVHEVTAVLVRSQLHDAW